MMNLNMRREEKDNIYCSPEYQQTRAVAPVWSGQNPLPLWHTNA